MYIFLDIDGVLVKKVEPGKEDPVIVINVSDLYEEVPKFDQDCLNEFESVIRQHKQSQIVIDSSWREWFAFETIKTLFSNDVADKVIGVTPEASEWVKYFRYKEIIDYLKQNKALEEPWVAIDDIAAHFPENAPVIQTNKYRGFDKNAARKLEYFLLNGHCDS